MLLRNNKIIKFIVLGINLIALLSLFSQNEKQVELTSDSLSSYITTGERIINNIKSQFYFSDQQLINIFHFLPLKQNTKRALLSLTYKQA